MYIYILEISHNFFAWRCRFFILINMGSGEIDIFTKKYEWFLKVFLLYVIICSVF